MRTNIARLSSFVALTVLAPAAAWAQDAAPAATEPALPPAPAAAAAETTPVTATAVAAPAAPEAGPKPIPGWIRIDSDSSALQLWGGGTFPLTDTIGLAFDMYVNSAFLGEFDIGPAFTAGPFIITPMLGLQMDWAGRHAQALVPQLYVTGGPSPIYMELWVQYYINKIFNDDPSSNALYARLIVDYKLTDYVAIGPEIDLGYDSVGLPNSEGELKKLNSLPIGVNVLLSNVGAASSFMGYLAYETMDPAGNDKHATGRLTFIHNF